MKTYAKVLNKKIIAHPYDFLDLCKENPNTTYDDRFTVQEWYAQTEDAKVGYTLQEVIEEPYPDINGITHIAVQLAPIFENNILIKKYIVNQKPIELQDLPTF